MAVIRLPKDTYERCIICNRKRTLADVSVALSDEFVCDEHFKEGKRLILGLAEYMASQRLIQPEDTLVPKAGKGDSYIELRQLTNMALSWDIAHHLLIRQLPGKVMVITERPLVTLSAASKQWHKMIRAVQHERAATLKPLLIRELGQMLHHMEHLHMTLKKPHPSSNNEVFFVAKVEKIPADCHTLYVTTPMDDTDFDLLSGKMPNHAVIVRYRIAK